MNGAPTCNSPCICALSIGKSRYKGSERRGLWCFVQPPVTKGPLLISARRAPFVGSVFTAWVECVVGQNLKARSIERGWWSIHTAEASKDCVGGSNEMRPWRLTGSTLMWNQTTYLVPFSSSPENRFRKKTNATSIRRHLLTWLSPTTVRKIPTCSKPLFLSTISSRSCTAPTSYTLSKQLSTMTRSSTSSFLLVLLASLSIVSALATPHGDLPHTSHWPNKDYSYEHPRKRQDLTVPTILGSCVLVGGLAVGDQVLVAGDIRYSQLCLQQLAFSLVPEERAVCRRECPTCPFVRGYDIPCITTQVVRRAAQVDLAQLRDTDQQVRTPCKLCKFALTISPRRVSWLQQPLPIAPFLSKKLCTPSQRAIGPHSPSSEPRSSTTTALLGAIFTLFLPRPPVFPTTTSA